MPVPQTILGRIAEIQQSMSDLRRNLENQKTALDMLLWVAGEIHTADAAKSAADLEKIGTVPLHTKDFVLRELGEEDWGAGDEDEEERGEEESGTPTETIETIGEPFQPSLAETEPGPVLEEPPAAHALILEHDAPESGAAVTPEPAPLPHPFPETPEPEPASSPNGSFGTATGVERQEMILRAIRQRGSADAKDIVQALGGDYGRNVKSYIGALSRSGKIRQDRNGKWSPTGR